MRQVERPSPTIGAGPLLWIGILILFGVVMAVLLVVSTWTLITEPEAPEVLVERGLVPADEPVLAYADLSDELDLSDGCLLTPSVAVQWQGGGIVASVPLPGATVTADVTDVTIRGLDATALCRFQEPSEAQAFATLAARLAAVPRG